MKSSVVSTPLSVWWGVMHPLHPPLCPRLAAVAVQCIEVVLK